MTRTGITRRTPRLREATSEAKKHRTQEELELRLQRILSSIANLLVGTGYSYGRISKLTKIAFVNAAAAIDRDAGEKVSIARIAASTGLTRTEVSRLLRTKSQNLSDMPGPQNRAIRVAVGWLSDKDFRVSRGDPRPLHFSAGKRNFSQLVKRYSGDIPARAMLLEMKRAEMIRLGDDDLIHLVRREAPVPRKTVSAMRAISPWVDSLWESIQTAGPSELSSRTSQLSLHFDSLPQVKAALREINERRIAFVSGVSEMGTRYSRESRYDLRITIAVASTTPTRATQDRLKQDFEK